MDQTSKTTTQSVSKPSVTTAQASVDSPVVSQKPTSSEAEQYRKQTKIITYVSGSIVGLMFITILALMFLSTGKVKQIGQLKQQIADKISDENSLQASVDYFNQNQTKFNDIIGVLPNEESLVDFVNSLEIITKQNSSQSSIQFSAVAPTGSGQDKFLPFIIKLTTNPENFNEYVKRLEKIPYLVEVVSIQARYLENSENIWEYTISARVYVREPFKS